MPTFSIIIPAYKVEKYLGQCLESVLCQSYGDFEVIVVDDGSPDSSGKIADDYAARDSRVRVIHKENGGVVTARITGARAALGKYIMSVDGDDGMIDGALEIVAEKLDETGADVCCFGFKTEGMGTKRVELPDFEEKLYSTPEERGILYSRLIVDKTKPFYTFGFPPSIWSKAIRRDLYVKYQTRVDTKISTGSDFATTIPIMLEAKKICYIRKALYDYRIEPGTLSHRHDDRSIMSIGIVVKSITSNKSIDLDSFNLREQLGTYCVEMIFNYILAVSRTIKTYKEFKSRIKKLDKEVLDLMSHAKIKIDSPKTAVAAIPVKNKMWHLTWCVMKIVRAIR